MTAPESGVLYLCATPIGNLEDITLRVLRVLQEVDLIAAEDTRHTRKLLNHYDIRAELTSYHDHNRRSKGENLLQQLAAGQNVALVSDAGMPGISDPGEELVVEALKRGIPVIPLPGPSALITALVVSGLAAERFVFEGFLPRKNKDRAGRLSELATEGRTIIIYEAPHRLIKTLEELLNCLGDRPACAARELTKRYEEVRRGSISQLLEHFSAHAPKGEFVLVVGGYSGSRETVAEGWEDRSLTPDEQVRILTDEGLSPNEAIKKVARLMGMPRRELYQRLKTNRTGKEK